MALEGRGFFFGCLALLLLLVVTGAFLVGVAAFFGEREITSLSLGPKVGVVEIFGVIGEDDEALEQLDDLTSDASVKALVLHVNSPGGSVGTAQRIVSRIQALEVPVVAALDDVAASGGYYVATAADSIFALPGTLTGSIGVIMSFPDFSALMKKIGVEYQVVKTGPYKDAGSPFRALEAEERQWISAVLDDVHGQFVEAIADGRGMPADSVEALADGRFFSGRMAMDWGLVDRLGDLDSAIAAAAEMAGIEGDPAVIRQRPRRRIWEEWIEERMPDLRLGSSPHLEFRWR
jgi:protease IV